MDDLRRACRQWKNMSGKEYEKGMQLMEGHVRGFRHGCGVLYKNLQAIDVEEDNLYFIPNGRNPRDVGIQGGTVWEKGENDQWIQVMCMM